MFNKTDKKINCDVVGCMSTDTVLFYQDKGWKWINEKDICPKCQKLKVKEFKNV